jgi:hypothetical protein
MKKSQQKASRKRSYWLAEKQKRWYQWHTLLEKAKKSYRRMRKYTAPDKACCYAAEVFPQWQRSDAEKVLQKFFARREYRILVGR